MRLDPRLLGWGVFFILVGAIPLLTNADYLDEAVVGRWPTLWPLLLIGWGIGLVFRHTPLALLGGAVTAVTFGLMGGGALATGFGGVPAFGGCGGDAPGTAFASQNGALAGSGQLNIEFSCGTLTVGAVDGSDWSVSGTDGNGRGPRVTTSGASVSIESTNEGMTFFENVGRATWQVAVPRSPDLTLGVTLNAGEGNVDLAGATIASANLTVNAGSLTMDLAGAGRLGGVNGTVNAGNSTLNLPGGGRSVNLSLNAGNLDVCLPTGTAVRVNWNGTLGSNDLDDAGLTEVEDDTWTSAGFDETQPHVEMNVTANAGSFGLAFGGSCDA
jgi:hypothetical protein